MVLCCICGIEITGQHSGARCLPCLQREVDITEGISRKIHIHRCGTCARWLRPPHGQWIIADLESRELLSLCLRQIKGITREHKLVNATFLWTEPHSKELKVKIELQKEALAGAIVQQSMVVEFRIDNHQCADCKKTFTSHVWESNVQVRQRATHRRTLLHLEQLILAHKAHKALIGLEHTKEGIDFFFKKERDAQAFVAFVKSWAVIKHQESKHLVSHNANNSTYRFKRTTCVEICTVCRDDLVFLPPKVSQALGGISSLMLCNKASSVISLVDPVSSRKVELSAVEYWKRPFHAVCTSEHLTSFIVLDVDVIDDAHDRGSPTSSSPLSRSVCMCLVEVARMSDFGENDERLTVRSHLGLQLQPGDTALGYDLRTLNVGLDEDQLGGPPQLDIYLVRKEKTPKKDKQRDTGTTELQTKHADQICDSSGREGEQQTQALISEEGVSNIDLEDEEDSLEMKKAAGTLLSTIARSDEEPADDSIAEINVAISGASASAAFEREQASAPEHMNGKDSIMESIEQRRIEKENTELRVQPGTVGSHGKSGSKRGRRKT